MKAILLVLILLTQSAFGCTKPVTHLLEGDKAPCEGYLFSPEQEKEVRGKVEIMEQQTHVIQDQDALIVNLKQQIDNETKQTQNLNSQLNASSWDKYIYFGLGVLATSAAIYGASHLK